MKNRDDVRLRDKRPTIRLKDAGACKGREAVEKLDKITKKIFE